MPSVRRYPIVSGMALTEPYASKSEEMICERSDDTVSGFTAEVAAGSATAEVVAGSAAAACSEIGAGAGAAGFEPQPQRDHPLDWPAFAVSAAAATSGADCGGGAAASGWAGVAAEAEVSGAGASGFLEPQREMARLLEGIWPSRMGPAAALVLSRVSGEARLAPVRRTFPLVIRLVA